MQNLQKFSDSKYLIIFLLLINQRKVVVFYITVLERLPVKVNYVFEEIFGSFINFYT